MATNSSVFTDIARDPLHPDPIYRDEQVIVLRDINPKAPVHLLIIPIMPLTSLAQIGPNQESLIGHMFVVAEEMARREGVTGTGFRLVVNQGDDSGQEIAHLHMHLLGGQKLGAMG
ncbi:MAG: HIT domain-containing protein [Chloroflexi bacterium]|nr:HIT domain-containing protein [Chloroflexota bacterium]MCH8898376.1 HIT domain-containing protein [Chloroflexota bacterium]